MMAAREAKKIMSDTRRKHVTIITLFIHDHMEIMSYLGYQGDQGE